MMLISNETGKITFTQMETETRDLFSQSQPCNRLDTMVAQQYFESQSKRLMIDPGGQDKLESLGLKDTSLIERFGVGTGDRAKSILRSDSNISEKEKDSLQHLGIMTRSGHYAFSGAIIFPLYYDIYYSPVGIYGYWCSTKEGFEPDMYTLWGESNVGVFNLDGLNCYSDLIVCHSPLNACQLIERSMDNCIAIMGNGDTVEQYYRLFKHAPTESVRILCNGTQYDQFWKQQVSEALRVLNIACTDYVDA